MFKNRIWQIGLVSSCVLAASHWALAETVASTTPGDASKAKDEMDRAKMSLIPPSLPVPPALLLGTPDLDDAGGLRLAPLALPPATGTSLFDSIGDLIEAQDVPGPTGILTTVHFHLPGDGVGKWMPFVSVLQDADEIDAHLRNGVGAGVTYQFTHHARMDIETDYIENAGDVNPALSNEGRVNVLFSFDF